LEDGSSGKSNAGFGKTEIAGVNDSIVYYCLMVPVNIKLSRTGRLGLGPLYAAALVMLLEAESGKEVPFAFVEYVSYGLLRRVVVRSSDRREVLKIRGEVEKIKAGFMPERKEERFCKECNFSEHCIPDSSLMSKFF
jgi:CRISPR/Cas system-associated exonuclease Cas4 (RecB family)